MLKRAGSCELHERRAPFGPRDRPSGPLLRRRQVVTGIARLLIEKDMLARMGRLLENKSVNLFTQRLGGIVAIVTHGRHEEFFADRESRGERIEKSGRSEEHTSELPSLMRTSYAVCCLKTKSIYTYYMKC